MTTQKRSPVEAFCALTNQSQSKFHLALQSGCPNFPLQYTVPNQVNNSRRRRVFFLSCFLDVDMKRHFLDRTGLSVHHMSGSLTKRVPYNPVET